jgi:hypothetical protein
MTMRTHRIVGDLPYYILSCATCASDFACRDDSCYQRASLRLSAEIAGWSIGTQPAWAHRCPRCRRGASPDQSRMGRPAGAHGG